MARALYQMYRNRASPSIWKKVLGIGRVNFGKSIVFCKIKAPDYKQSQCNPPNLPMESSQNDQKDPCLMRRTSLLVCFSPADPAASLNPQLVVLVVIMCTCCPHLEYTSSHPLTSKEGVTSPKVPSPAFHWSHPVERG